MSRLHEQYSLHPLTGDERTTCQSMLQHETARVLVMPTHHINELGDMMGFRFACGAYAPGNTLPVVRTMFHGHTLVECRADEALIMRLMADPEANRRRMLAFLEGVERESVPATLDCAPENCSSRTAHGTLEAQGLLTVDSQHWTPELPERIGIYHAYIRGFNRDVRTHRLFIVCSGGLVRASDAFCNLVIDVGKLWTAQEVCDSQEAWWLRKGCLRARSRLIKRLADAFDIPVQAVQDIQAHTGGEMAVHTSDTVEHDLARLGPDQVAVYNLCTDTTRHMNGIVTNMHPSEGVWLFRGAPRGNCFGSMFGDHATCGAFPTSSPQVRRALSITVQDTPQIVRLRSPRARAPYMCFDEAYFKMLESMQWNRDNGCVELIPIVVGMP